MEYVAGCRPDDDVLRVVCGCCKDCVKIVMEEKEGGNFKTLNLS